jgi:hypothetical protein
MVGLGQLGRPADAGAVEDDRYLVAVLLELIGRREHVDHPSELVCLGVCEYDDCCPFHWLSSLGGSRVR